MNTAADARATPLRRRISAGAVAVGGSPPSALAEFEEVYRSNVDVVMAYFARRCADPQAVADLTSETFVRAAGAFGSFDPRRGSARAWLFGIAAHVFARHCAESTEARDTACRLAGHRSLDDDEIGELAARIDAEREGRALMTAARSCPQLSGRRSSSSTSRG